MVTVALDSRGAGPRDFINALKAAAPGLRITSVCRIRQGMIGDVACSP